MRNVLKKLLSVQSELKCRKDKKATNYKYRSAEDILENLKPILASVDCTILISDDVEIVWEETYYKSTITFYDIESEESVSNHSYVKEWEAKFMSVGQYSWATISYCRKYALCGLFSIDDWEDLDSVEWKEDKSESKTTIQRLEEARDNSIQMLYNGFKERVENIDMGNEKAVLRILDEWRNLVKYGTEEIKREVTEICIGIKKVLDERKKENGN